jgi:hypothetical protein
MSVALPYSSGCASVHFMALHRSSDLTGLFYVGCVLQYYLLKGLCATQTVVYCAKGLGMTLKKSLG